MISRHSLVLSALLLSSCAPTNPFDPNAPVELQAKARIVGHLKGDVHASPAFLTLLDRGGQPIRDANGGAVTQFPTLAVDAPLPQGLEAVAGLPYAIEGLVPGTYTVLFNAAVNNEPLLLDAQSSPATVVAGATAVLDLSANKRDINDVGGAVRGAVDGAEGGATFVVRLVSKDGNPDLEQLAILSDNGSFSFRHVPAGEYKVAAAGDSYAPATVLHCATDRSPAHMWRRGRVMPYAWGAEQFAVVRAMWV